MLLSRLTCENFRIFSQLEVDFNQGLQCITGLNGSGKSSILEAIVFTVTGRSFRSARSQHMIKQGCDNFRVWLDLPEGHTMALQKPLSGRTVLRQNDAVVKTQSSFARSLPIIFIDTHTHRLFSEDAKHRRQLIDWMMFHVKHSAFEDWVCYQKALKQRNESIKQGSQDLDVWDQMLNKYAETIDKARSEIYTQWRAIFDEMVLPFVWTGDLGYKRGWAEDKTLLASLQQTRHIDTRRGYTTTGPHRFDIVVQEYDNMAYHILSQGQQKVLNGFMRLAAANYIKRESKKSSLWLIDDLPAELDDDKQESWLKELRDSGDQAVVTALPKASIQIPISLSLEKELI